MAQQVRAAGSRTLLVALSSLTEDSHRQRGLAAGFDEYLFKPIKASALRAEITRQLGRGSTIVAAAAAPSAAAPTTAVAVTRRPRALRTDPRALSVFTDRRDWQTVNTALGGRAYGVAAEAVLAIERRVDRVGVTGLLEAVGRGGSLEDAFRSALGETLDDFIARLPTTAH